MNTVARLPDEVFSILALLRESIQAVLSDELVGLYLYGSLASGDFDPASSDVDFVAVTQTMLPDETCERLREMHARISASGLPFATRLEGSYIPTSHRCRGRSRTAGRAGW